MSGQNIKPRQRGLGWSVKKAVLFFRLSWHNRVAKLSIVNKASNVTVSLTTHSTRINRVHAAIESIGLGRMKPARLILYLSKEFHGKPLPSALKRLVRRGLEVEYCEDVGPHTKYYPYIRETQTFHEPLVTADDDKMYSPYWLESLHQAWLGFPHQINCFRARVVGLDGEGFLPYANWPLCTNDSASFLHFATGVSGVIYTPSYLVALKASGEAFKEICPYGDDIWLHRVALRNGFRVRQVQYESLEFPGVPLSSRTALHTTNIGLGRNDQQILLSYEACDLATLRSEAVQT